MPNPETPPSKQATGESEPKETAEQIALQEGIKSIKKTIEDRISKTSLPSLEGSPKTSASASQPVTTKTGFLTKVKTAIKKPKQKQPTEKEREKIKEKEAERALLKTIEENFNDFEKLAQKLLKGDLSIAQTEQMKQFEESYKKLISSIPDAPESSDYSALKKHIIEMHDKVINASISSLVNELNEAFDISQLDFSKYDKSILLLSKLRAINNVFSERKISCTLLETTNEKIKKGISDAFQNLKTKIDPNNIVFSPENNMDRHHAENGKARTLLNRFKSLPNFLPKEAIPSTFKNDLEVSFNQLNKHAERLNKKAATIINHLTSKQPIETLYSDTQMPVQKMPLFVQISQRKNEIEFLQILKDELSKNQKIDPIEKARILRGATDYLDEKLNPTSTTIGIDRFKKMLVGLKEKLIFLPPANENIKTMERKKFTTFVNENRAAFGNNPNAKGIAPSTMTTAFQQYKQGKPSTTPEPLPKPPSPTRKFN